MGFIKAEERYTLQEKSSEEKIYSLYKNSSIPEDEALMNLSMYIDRIQLGRLLFFNELYKKIIHVPGKIFECGVRWGRNLTLLSSLRELYEPYNYTREVIGFDTFEGFVGVNPEDGNNIDNKVGGYGVTQLYEEELKDLLDAHNMKSALSHIPKDHLVKGDISKTLPEYLEANPDTVISYIHFDLDLYQPTKDTLMCVKPYLTKGAILSFDELMDKSFPGETIALREVFGINNIRLQRMPFYTRSNYFIIE